MSLASAQTRTARSGDEQTDLEANAPSNNNNNRYALIGQKFDWTNFEELFFLGGGERIERICLGLVLNSLMSLVILLLTLPARIPLSITGLYDKLTI